MFELSANDGKYGSASVFMSLRRHRFWRGALSVMTAVTVIIAGATGAVALVGVRAASAVAGRILYASPSGSDQNPGTAAAPWKSMYHATLKAVAGDTVVFADGQYNETRIAQFANSGTATQRITVRAAHQHQAKIRYIGNTNSVRLLAGRPYISIVGFDIYADPWAATADSTDILVAFTTGGDYGQVIGNRIHGVYEDALKVSHVVGTLIDGNILYDTAHEGLDVVNVANVVVRNNVVNTIGRTGMCAKGGSRNVWFIGNTVGSPRAGADSVIAYSLGGSTAYSRTYDPKGYEGYRLVMINNVAYSDRVGAMGTGVSFQGCADCAAFNNVIIGAKAPVRTRDGGDPTGVGGAAWIAYTRNPTFVNNIATECAGAPVLAAGTLQGVWDHDYNLYHNCPKLVAQLHGVSDPLFVSKYRDWHLKAGSLAIDAGRTLTTFAPYTDAGTPATVALDLRYDRYRVLRTGTWDLGVYDVPTV